jgi:hypothetical protein
VLLFFLCATPLILYLREKKATSAQSQVIPYQPVTWSEFKEVHRLKMLVEGLGIETLLDLPCRDIEALPIQQLGLKHYLGLTPERGEALRLQAQFGSQLRTFIYGDVVRDPLPKVDLIVCWDQLCTLSACDVRTCLLQFKKSGAKFVLMRHFPENKENRDHPNGEYAPINWKLPPYAFPEPLIQIVSKKEHGMECLALWNLEKL